MLVKSGSIDTTIQQVKWFSMNDTYQAWRSKLVPLNLLLIYFSWVLSYYINVTNSNLEVIVI